jgi:predicted transcriptional regulator
MGTLTLKIAPQLEAALEKAAKAAHVTKSEFVRRALVAYTARQIQTPFVSALEQAGDLAGCFAGGPKDLSSNPRHLDGFGKR